MQQIRIGIIGTGIMGANYAKVFSALPFSTVVAACSRNESNLNDFLRRHRIQAGYTDYRKMLERTDLDAIVVATPDRHHFAPARDALESGHHVLVEKPFTTSTAESERLQTNGRKKPKKNQVAVNPRWLPAYFEA